MHACVDEGMGSVRYLLEPSLTHLPPLTYRTHNHITVIPSLTYLFPPTYIAHTNTLKGEPLWSSPTPPPAAKAVPPCEACGGPREFELQVCRWMDARECGKIDVMWMHRCVVCRKPIPISLTHIHMHAYAPHAAHAHPPLPPTRRRHCRRLLPQHQHPSILCRARRGRGHGLGCRGGVFLCEEL